MVNIVVAGIGTDVGKTVVSAILTKLYGGEYWKPVQSGVDHPDSEEIAKLLGTNYKIHPPSYVFQAPLSPHHAALQENQTIDPQKIQVPHTSSPLIIEMAGGVLVPLNDHLLSLDHFAKWDAYWIVVSRHYLGSINHTLLTLRELEKKTLRF